MPITKATITDTQELTALVNSAYRGEGSKQGWTSESHLLDGVRIDDLTMLTYLQDDRVTILKYLNNDNQIIGCVYLEARETWLYMGLLTVSPLLQGAGIGKELLAAASEHARKLHHRKIEITVISSRSELIAWYQRHGYKPTGELRPFPKDDKFGIVKEPIELMVMEKQV